MVQSQLSNKKGVPKTSISYFWCVFGEESHLDYEPNSKLKVPQMIY